MMRELVQKADSLIEALPYIKRFRGKEVLIKYGGAVMTSPEIRENVLHDLVFMNYVGIRPILIHGGGPLINDALKKKKIPTKFIEGLRVTDKKTMEVVVETLEEINKEIVHDINHYGARAIGLGYGNEILIARKRQMEGGVEVGYVGEVMSVNVMPLKELTEFNIIPVVYPVGVDAHGEIYNVNADEAAAKIAAAMQVQKVMILTNVQGILRNVEDPESLISSLDEAKAQQLIEQGVVQGGMIPKVRACITALVAGVRKAHIIDGRMKHSLLLEIFTDQGIGTEIVRRDEAE